MPKITCKQCGETSSEFVRHKQADHFNQKTGKIVYVSRVKCLLCGEYQDV